MNTIIDSGLQSPNSQKLREAKRLERIFIYHRWLYVLAIILTALVYHTLSVGAIAALATSLGLANVSAWLLNLKIKTPHTQTILSVAMLSVDALASWGLMLLFISEPYAIVYAVCVLIIIEGAVRFHLGGSLVMGAFFILGLSAAWIYRVSSLKMNFDLPAYVFWVGLITLVSLMVGMVVREWSKQRSYAESLATERALLLERRRISNELHDSVLKSLQGLAFEAHVLSHTKGYTGPSPVEERAHYIEDVCNRMSQEIRGVVFELRDDGKDTQEGIALQITRQVKSWSSSSGIAVEIACSTDIPTLPLKLAHDLRRIIGEALTNVQRHAKASHVSISLEATPGRLSLDIADNGHGFNCDPRELYSFVSKGRLGLVSMKERVELAGGSLAIKSDNGGTRLTAVIPLQGERIQSGTVE